MHKPQEVHCQTETWAWHGMARLVAFANGKSFGNSIYIAPTASQEDGILNSFIVGNLPLIKFLFYLYLIKRKKQIRSGQVIYDKMSRTSLRSPERCAIETDGELAGYLPVEVEILPQRIKFLR